MAETRVGEVEKTSKANAAASRARRACNENGEAELVGPDLQEERERVEEQEDLLSLSLVAAEEDDEPPLDSVPPPVMADRWEKNLISQTTAIEIV